MRLSRNNRVADLSRWSPPKRIRRTPDGPVEEKLPPQITAKVVDPAGNVGFLPLTNGVSLRDRRDPYGVTLLAEKIAGRPRMLKGTPGGFVPYGKCPQTIEEVEPFLPRSIRGRPRCVVAADGHEIGDEHACACVEAIIAERQQKTRIATEAFERKMEPKINQSAREAAAVQTDVIAKLAEVTTQLASAVSAIKPPRGKS